jgi:hypothetical protein
MLMEAKPDIASPLHLHLVTQHWVDGVQQLLAANIARKLFLKEEFSCLVHEGGCLILYIERDAQLVSIKLVSPAHHIMLRTIL